jgi:hypothetical protein
MPAYAAGNGFFGGSNFLSNFVNFFSQKFGLDKTQVTNAMNDFHTQQMANTTPRPTPTQQQMDAREKARLDPLVTSGKITAAQETAIIAELDALHTKYPPSAGQTSDQRKTQMQNMQNDWKTWATANNIDPTIVGAAGVGMMGGRGRGFGRGNWGKTTPTPTPTP